MKYLFDRLGESVLLSCMGFINNMYVLSPFFSNSVCYSLTSQNLLTTVYFAENNKEIIVTTKRLLLEEKQLY